MGSTHYHQSQGQVTAPQQGHGVPKRLIVPLRSQRIALTFVVVLATAAIRFALTPWLGNDAPFLLFTLPVLGLAIFAGTVPAMVAIGLSFVAGWLFISTGGSATANAIHAGLFLIVGNCIVWLATVFRRSNAQLESAERHLRSILETVPEAMIVVGEDGLVLSFSPAAERMFGRPEAAVVGQAFTALIRDSQLPGRNSIADYMAVEADTVAPDAGLMGVHAKGALFPIELAVGEALSDGRQLFTGFVRDLSHHRASAARIASLQARLDQVGRLGAMGAMASTLAHELNQPITAAAAYIGAVRLQIEAGQPATLVDATLNDAESEALRAGDIIRNLRAYVAHGEVDRSVEPLAPLIREAVALALADGRAVGVDIAYDLAVEAVAVHVNRVQLQQALINLVRNAVEAMEGCAQRQLTLATRAEPGGGVQISVSDTGAGIDAETAGRLFEAFTTTKARGLGLGLPISRTIIEANGGSIWAAPATGRGSTFHIRLVMANAPAAATLAPH